jgi:hypothetical protein
MAPSPSLHTLRISICLLAQDGSRASPREQATPYPRGRTTPCSRRSCNSRLELPAGHLRVFGIWFVRCSWFYWPRIFLGFRFFAEFAGILRGIFTCCEVRDAKSIGIEIQRHDVPLRRVPHLDRDIARKTGRRTIEFISARFKCLACVRKRQFSSPFCRF